MTEEERDSELDYRTDLALEAEGERRERALVVRSNGNGFDLAPYGFTLTPTGLQPLSESVPYQDWETCGLLLHTYLKQLTQRALMVQFAIGDWLVYGEQHYPDIYAQALDETKYDYGTLRNFKSVARSVPVSLRNDTLSFAHHQAIAPLDPPQQREWLQRAVDESLSAAELREQVQAARGIAPKHPHIVTCPECGTMFEV